MTSVGPLPYGRGVTVVRNVVVEAERAHPISHGLLVRLTGHHRGPEDQRGTPCRRLTWSPHQHSSMYLDVKILSLAALRPLPAATSIGDRAAKTAETLATQAAGRR